MAKENIQLQDILLNPITKKPPNWEALFVPKFNSFFFVF